MTPTPPKPLAWREEVAEALRYAMALRGGFGPTQAVQDVYNDAAATIEGLAARLNALAKPYSATEETLKTIGEEFAEFYWKYAGKSFSQDAVEFVASRLSTLSPPAQAGGGEVTPDANAVRLLASRPPTPA